MVNAVGNGRAPSQAMQNRGRKRNKGRNQDPVFRAVELVRGLTSEQRARFEAALLAAPPAYVPEDALLASGSMLVDAPPDYVSEDDPFEDELPVDVRPLNEEIKAAPPQSIPQPALNPPPGRPVERVQPYNPINLASVLKCITLPVLALSGASIYMCNRWPKGSLSARFPTMPPEMPTFATLTPQEPSQVTIHALPLDEQPQDLPVITIHTSTPEPPALNQAFIDDFLNNNFYLDANEEAQVYVLDLIQNGIYFPEQDKCAQRIAMRETAATLGEKFKQQPAIKDIFRFIKYLNDEELEVSKQLFLSPELFFQDRNWLQYKKPLRVVVNHVDQLKIKTPETMRLLEDYKAQLDQVRSFVHPLEEPVKQAVKVKPAETGTIDQKLIREFVLSVRDPSRKYMSKQAQYYVLDLITKGIHFEEEDECAGEFLPGAKAKNVRASIQETPFLGDVLKLRSIGSLSLENFTTFRLSLAVLSFEELLLQANKNPKGKQILQNFVLQLEKLEDKTDQTKSFLQYVKPRIF